MSKALLETVEVGAVGDADASVIWLHGLGADGHDFEPLVPELRLPAERRVRFVFPHAPERPVTLNGGMTMRAWFDLYGLDETMPEDAEGIAASAEQVEALIDREHERGVPAGRLVLAGFSQGGAVALHTALRHPESLAGIMGLSTYLPLRDRLAQAHSANAATPLFMAHGTADPVLPFAFGQRSAELLREAGYAVQWQEYPMQHAVCLEEVRDIGDWLQRVLGTAAA